MGNTVYEWWLSTSGVGVHAHRLCPSVALAWLAGWQPRLLLRLASVCLCRRPWLCTLLLRSTAEGRIALALQMSMMSQPHHPLPPLCLSVGLAV
ncbi:uncharacterized protein [Argopecten irradians]|uniref:uncharacterized protein isoform X2 n=1 Tax=Argopecten irradians TaxID=31199 RepID=UPI003715420F